MIASRTDWGAVGPPTPHGARLSPQPHFFEFTNARIADDAFPLSRNHSARRQVIAPGLPSTAIFPWPVPSRAALIAVCNAFASPDHSPHLPFSAALARPLKSHNNAIAPAPTPTATPHTFTMHTRLQRAGCSRHLARD